MNDNAKVPARRLGAARAQRGVVLFIALIALVAMTIAGLALIRSVGSGLLVAGNLGFKRNATSAADYGIEAGRKWLTDQVRPPTTAAPGVSVATPIDLNSSNPAQGYYADWATFDPISGSWADTNSVRVPAADLPQSVSEVRYVVHRLCGVPGAPKPEECVTARSLAGASGAGAPSYNPNDASLTAAGSVYFRVTARVVGSKGTVSLVQTVMF